jgi:MinD superfamily P-loop ATPase
MIISVASGKGGTGKTTVAVNIALSCENIQLLDCDVEEPNIHVLLKPELLETRPVNVSVPSILEERCDYCRRCAEFCRYNALFVIPEQVLVFPELCHDCGGCALVCPRDAVTFKKREIGQVKRGTADGMEIIWGELKIGEPHAIPVIDEVKKRSSSDGLVLVDCPPGTACPVVASVYGSDYCLLVTEPTPFGLHDLKIAVQVLRRLEIPFGVIVNSMGIGDRRVHQYCEEGNIPILLEIPFQRKIAELYAQGIPFVREMPEWKERFQSLLERVTEEAIS